MKEKFLIENNKNKKEKSIIKIFIKKIDEPAIIEIGKSEKISKK